MSNPGITPSIRHPSNRVSAQVTAPETGDVLSPVRPELAGLVQPDGTVVVPAAVASEVLRLLVFALNERARGTGGVPTPAACALLHALYEAAARRPGGPDAEPGPVPLAGATVSVSEAADLMGCSPQWVRHLLGAGRLAGRRTTGGAWLVQLPPAAPQADRAAG